MSSSVSKIHNQVYTPIFFLNEKLFDIELISVPASTARTLSCPCRNGGVCSATGPQICTCSNGFTGRFCESLLRKYNIYIFRKNVLDFHLF